MLVHPPGLLQTVLALLGVVEAGFGVRANLFDDAFGDGTELSASCGRQAYHLVASPCVIGLASVPSALCVCVL